MPRAHSRAHTGTRNRGLTWGHRAAFRPPRGAIQLRKSKKRLRPWDSPGSQSLSLRSRVLPSVGSLLRPLGSRWTRWPDHYVEPVILTSEGQSVASDSMGSGPSSAFHQPSPCGPGKFLNLPRLSLLHCVRNPSIFLLGLPEDEMSSCFLSTEDDAPSP